MKFKVERASEIFNDSAKYEIEIDTLEDLEKFDKDTGFHSLVIDFARTYLNPLPTITIYDDYIE